MYCVYDKQRFQSPAMQECYLDYTSHKNNPKCLLWYIFKHLFKNIESLYNFNKYEAKFEMKRGIQRDTGIMFRAAKFCLRVNEKDKKSPSLTFGMKSKKSSPED